MSINPKNSQHYLITVISRNDPGAFAWISYFSNVIRNNKNDRQSTPQFDIQEIDDASRLWIKKSQYESFVKKIRKLNGKKKLPNHNRSIELNAPLHSDVTEYGYPEKSRTYDFSTIEIRHIIIFGLCQKRKNMEKKYTILNDYFLSRQCLYDISN
ncbi:hypothetical protein JTB14_032434 [Gonioctena quinquepunctata]|nr:hypothetical protein JTB14_032434 [Gonioctena quinquepunctata]